MPKSVPLAFALLALIAAQALAAEAPATVEDCLKRAIALAETTEAKTMGDETRGRIEDSLLKLESHCEESKFSEAGALIAEIESQLEGS